MKVYIDVHDKRWNKYNIDFEKIVYTAIGAVYKDSEVSIVLVNDDEIHTLNNTYRGIDKPTNVLSFELGDDVLLGDIYIALDTVQRQAKDANISVEEHVAHMVVHGALHLTGHDHIDDSDAKIMEAKEIKILDKLGIKNPYEDDVCNSSDCCPMGGIIAWIHKLKIRKNSFVQYALYALFGGVAAFGFAPFNCWFCTLVGVGGAYWLTVRNDKIGGFWRSILHVAPFSAVYCVAMFWWVLNSIYVVPDIAAQYAIWTVPAIIGLALAGVGIFSWPFVAIAKKGLNATGRIVLFATVWALVLWAREWMFTGFPWNPIANIAINYPLIANSMSVWGALGLSFVIVGLIASMIEVIRDKKSDLAWVFLTLFAGLMLLGGWFGYRNMCLADVGANNTTTMIRNVQPAFSQQKKATHNRADALEYAGYNLQRLLKLAAEPGDVDIIVLPETAYPFVVVNDDRIELASVLDKPVVFGANFFGAGGLFNSMVIAGNDGSINKVYSKSHLVPFGEYRPLGFLPAPVNLSAGKGPDLVRIDDFVFAPAICYEIIFSDSLLPSDSHAIDAIVNITNDNWFGNTPGTYQHLDMVRRYAIESGLPIVRANYSGISAFVASDGAVISSLPVGQMGVLDGYVWGAHETLYRKFGLNIWMMIILCFSILCLYVAPKDKK